MVAITDLDKVENNEAIETPITNKTQTLIRSIITRITTSIIIRVKT